MLSLMTLLDYTSWMLPVLKHHSYVLLVSNYVFFNIRFLFLVMCLFESVLILEQPHLTIVLDLPALFDIFSSCECVDGR
jgi:hypothetical protein